MANNQVIQEIDVLLAATAFLIERRVEPYQFSIPRGQGIDTQSARHRIWEVLDSIGIRRMRFSNQGADIIGISESEWWHIECKGSGSGTTQTQRNNFDRALASVVSYYGEETENLPDQYRQHRNAQPYLGLALPESRVYLNQLERRVRRALRQRLNLWVLLYEPESNSIRAVSPEDSY